MVCLGALFHFLAGDDDGGDSLGGRCQGGAHKRNEECNADLIYLAAPINKIIDFLETNMNADLS